MKTTSLVKVLGIATLAAAASIATSQAQTLIAHWELEETSLSDVGGGTYGYITESVAPTSIGRYWAVTGQQAYIDSVINQPGPGGADARAYRFDRTNNYGVSTYNDSIIPATGDFSIVVSFKKTYDGFQGHLFSNNNAQAGRANLFLQSPNVAAGDPMRLRWFLNNGSSFEMEGTTDILDDTWYDASISRQGNNWELRLNGNLEAAGTDSQAIGQGGNFYWMIGRDRGGANPFDGEISDVKVYDGYVIPEPGTFVLLGLGLGALVLVRRRRH
jgi:hypothetical protein